jgi:hypothetical protein
MPEFLGRTIRHKVLKILIFASMNFGLTISMMLDHDASGATCLSMLSCQGGRGIHGMPLPQLEL